MLKKLAANNYFTICISTISSETDIIQNRCYSKEQDNCFIVLHSGISTISNETDIIRRNKTTVLQFYIQV